MPLIQLRFIVCEFLTGGGLALEAAPKEHDLILEGKLMANAVVRSLRSIAPKAVFTMVDERLQHEMQGALMIIRASVDPWKQWEILLQQNKGSVFFPIAPETNGLLLKLTQMALQCGCTIWQADPAAIKITSNKYQTLQLLKTHGISTIPCGLNTIPTLPPLFKHTGWIVKPNVSAGCEHCYLLNSKIDVARYIKNLVPHCGPMVVQPYIDWASYGVSCLHVNGKYRLLSFNKHTLKRVEDKIKITAITVNGIKNEKNILNTLVEKIVKILPSLSGYFGIDILIHEKEIYVLEINPRITTSFCGIEQATGVNPLIHLAALLNNRKKESHAHNNATSIYIQIS